MESAKTLDYPRDITFEQVWASLMELRESQQETTRQIKNVSKQMGDLHRSFGELAEHLVAPNIAKRFNEQGYHFDAVSSGGHRILDEQGKTKTEIDILLENSKYIIAVEVKSKPKVQDIEHHINRLKILREHRNKQNDVRKICGAIAGAVFGGQEKQAVLYKRRYNVLRQIRNWHCLFQQTAFYRKRP
jgi:hypothetical protein